MTRIALLVAALWPLAGCYASHRVPTPSPSDDPEFDAETPLNLAFDEDGVLLGEGFPDDRFQVVAGSAPSLSDDGRWLVTTRRVEHEGDDLTLTARINDLVTGAVREFDMGGHSLASISGDGSALIYVRGEGGLDALVVADRATLEERVAVRAIHAALFTQPPSISDDARRAVVWTQESVSPDGARGMVVDVETGAVEPLRDTRGAYISGGTISGDGRSVTYWSFAHLDDFDAAEAVIVGPSGSAQALTGVARWDAISDDGCEFIAATEAVVEPTEGPPILGLAVFVDGRRVALGPEGEPTVVVSHVALSGDGGTAVMIVASMLVRIRLTDGRVETQDLGGCGASSLAVSDDGAVIAVGVFGCDASREPNEHTRVFRPGTW
jgi:hypothetical protein